MRWFFRSLWLVWFGGSLLVGAEIDLTVLASADLHGETAILRGPVAAAVAAARRGNPDGVLYCDAGDAAQGAFAVWQTRGAGVATLLGNAGCDVWAPGNHELEFGFPAFAAMVREFPNAVLAANLEAPELAAKVLPWKMFTRRGVKIAVIGLMLPAMNNCFPVERGRFETAASEAPLRRSVGAALDAGAEVVVLVRHGGVYSGGENLYTLLSRVPGVDLAVGAHTHQGEPGRRIAGSWYIQPPAHGEALARAVIVFDDVRRRIVRIESGLLPLPAVPEFAGEETRPARPLAGPAEDFTARAMRRATGAAVAIHAHADRGALRGLAENSSPTVLDYFRVFPYYDAVVTAELTPEEIRAILAEYTAFAFRRKQWLTASGVNFKLRKGTLSELAFPPPERLRYRVAMTSYAAAGAGGALPETRKIWRKNLDYGTVGAAPPLLQCVLDASL